jgi:prepilin-type N-terminal cleavage/methylation domain-containing protein/prepilin-type processing-associated H-X9-DG protein
MKNTPLQPVVPLPKAFTLVELLVVIGIISILIAMLLPALNKARRQAKAIACASQERQIAMALLMYAGQNDGWFPPTRSYTPNLFYDASLTTFSKTASAIHPYLQNPAVMRCPDSGVPDDWGPSGWDAIYNNPNMGAGRYIGSYWIMAGYCAIQSASTRWFGWTIYHQSTLATTYRVPIPRQTWAGRTIHSPGGVGGYGTQYIAPTDQQALVVDCYNPVTKFWNSYGITGEKIPNNHDGMGGENVAFVDGHVEWRRGTLDATGTALLPTSQVQLRFKIYAAFGQDLFACW